MSSTRSQDLTADLLHDLSDEPAARPTPTPTVVVTEQPNAVLEASLFLAPRGWRRPRIVRSGSSVAISAGPLRFRAGPPG